MEWKIYFLFPLLVWIWHRLGPAFVLAFSAAIGYGIVAGLHGISPIMPLQYLCPWYVFLFGMGVCAAPIALQSLGNRNLLSWVWIITALSTLLIGLLLAFPITSTGETRFFAPHLPLIDAAAGALTASALIVLSQNARAISPSVLLKVLSWQPLAFLGTFAYSLYLMHMPLLAVLIPMLNRMEGIGFAPSLKVLCLVVVGVPVIIAVSYLFSLVFERPFMSNYRSKAQSSNLNR